MSWAADDPEGYDALCRKSVARKLMTELDAHGFFRMDPDTLEAVVEVLCYEGGSMTDRNLQFWSPLVLWAQRELSDTEADRFASRIDDARERSESHDEL
jgi:hypothetical protein